MESIFECEIAHGCNQTLLGLVSCSLFEFVLANVHWQPIGADCALGYIGDCHFGNCNLVRVLGEAWEHLWVALGVSMH